MPAVQVKSVAPFLIFPVLHFGHPMNPSPWCLRVLCAGDQSRKEIFLSDVCVFFLRHGVEGSMDPSCIPAHLKNIVLEKADKAYIADLLSRERVDPSLQDRVIAATSAPRVAVLTVIGDRGDAGTAGMGSNLFRHVSVHMLSALGESAESASLRILDLMMPPAEARSEDAAAAAAEDVDVDVVDADDHSQGVERSGMDVDVRSLHFPQPQHAGNAYAASPYIVFSLQETLIDGLPSVLRNGVPRNPPNPTTRMRGGGASSWLDSINLIAYVVYRRAREPARQQPCVLVHPNVLEPPEAAAPALGNGSAPLEAASAAEDASDYGSDNDDDDMPPLADQHIHTLEFPLERCCSGLPFFMPIHTLEFPLERCCSGLPFFYAKQRIHTLKFPLERCCSGLPFFYAKQRIHTLEFPLEMFCSGLPFFYAKQPIHTLKFPLERCCLGLLFSMQHDPDYAFVYVFV
jgi:hypothetical protein